VTPTEAGNRLLARLRPALTEVEAALTEVSGLRDRPAGRLKLNVPISTARLVLPGIVPAFLSAYPEIQLEITAEEGLIDVLAAGCDAGIRYDERLEQDMIAVPIGPRVQRFAAAAAPSYLNKRGRPDHPKQLLQHDCLRMRFAGRAAQPWEFKHNEEALKVDVNGPLLIEPSGAVDLIVDAARSGSGIVYLFEDWLRPHLDSGALEAVLEPWWQSFSGPFLYYPGRRLVPPPLRAFIDFIKDDANRATLAEN
jgi:DNA-binding transcriptional LysR family regulator